MLWIYVFTNYEQAIMKKPAKISDSYMELCMHLDGEANVYLRVPTVWDDIEKTWIGFIKTPKTQKLIHASGKNSFDLQNSFNHALNECFKAGGELAEECFSMFKPLSYWNEM